LTSRFVYSFLNERCTFAVGQIFYFDTPQVAPINDDEKQRTSALAAESNAVFSQYWSSKAGIQYDTELNQASLGNAVFEYRKDAERLVQLNYRYASQEYSNDALPNKNYPTDLSQVGFVAAWPVTDRIGVVAQYYYDTKQQQPATQLLGLQYN
ncbi:LPS assembly protein LptD, partial [Plesiomonas shigelloides]